MNGFDDHFEFDDLIEYDEEMEDNLFNNGEAGIEETMSGSEDKHTDETRENQDEVTIVVGRGASCIWIRFRSV